MVVGLDEGQGLLDGDVALRCCQRVLEPAAVPGVVVDVVGGGRGTPALLASSASSRLRAVSPFRKFCWSSTYTPPVPYQSK